MILFKELQTHIATQQWIDLNWIEEFIEIEDEGLCFPQCDFISLPSRTQELEREEAQGRDRSEIEEKWRKYT